MFVTWRLWGSLPQERSFLPEHLTSGEAFVALDRLLDSTRMGPVYLRQDKIAGIVRDHLQGFKQIRHYIELNPVKAGLVAHPAEFLAPVPAGAKAGLKTRADLSPPSSAPAISRGSAELGRRRFRLPDW